VLDWRLGWRGHCSDSSLVGAFAARAVRRSRAPRFTPRANGVSERRPTSDYRASAASATGARSAFSVAFASEGAKRLSAAKGTVREVGFEPPADGRSLRSRCDFRQSSALTAFCSLRSQNCRASNPTFSSPPRGGRGDGAPRRRSWLECERWDSNPRTPTGAGLKPAAFGRSATLASHTRDGGEKSVTVRYEQSDCEATSTKTREQPALYHHRGAEPQAGGQNHEAILDRPLDAERQNGDDCENDEPAADGDQRAGEGSRAHATSRRRGCRRRGGRARSPRRCGGRRRG
jgi:hypothetical protein